MEVIDTFLELVTNPVAEGQSGEASLRLVQQVALAEFLSVERDGHWVTLYAWAYNHGTAFIQSFLADVDEVEEFPEEDATHWENGGTSRWSCGLVTGGGAPPRVELNENRLSFNRQEVETAQQLILHRHFDGRKSEKDYFELLQEVAIAHDLHWTQHLNSWCRMNEEGDPEPVVRVSRRGRPGQRGEATLVEINRRVLNLHLAATENVLIQAFDVIVHTGNFMTWDHSVSEELISLPTEGLYYRRHVETQQSWARGVQFLCSPMDRYEFGQCLEDEQRQPKMYESFLAFDVRNKRVAEISCDPRELINPYFGDTSSSKPSELSPVFFKPQVLDKYKADPEKYQLHHRSLSCRGGWGLETYDVNDAGQVHTWICYLGNLPYQEQRYWKSFNEAPKKSISRRAFMTDIQGQFDDEPDHLRELISLVESLHAKDATWFNLHQPELLHQLHYPHTGSDKAWGEALSTLAKVVNESFVQAYFERDAKANGAASDPNLRSLGWLRESLVRRAVEPEAVESISQPLRTLQNLRTKLDAHSAGAEAAEIRERLLGEYGNPATHISALCEALVDALLSIDSVYK